MVLCYQQVRWQMVTSDFKTDMTRKTEAVTLIANSCDQNVTNNDSIQMHLIIK